MLMCSYTSLWGNSNRFIAEVSARCFRWFPAAMLVIRGYQYGVSILSSLNLPINVSAKIIIKKKTQERYAIHTRDLEMLFHNNLLYITFVIISFFHWTVLKYFMMAWQRKSATDQRVMIFIRLVELISSHRKNAPEAFPYFHSSKAKFRKDF